MPVSYVYFEIHKKGLVCIFLSPQGVLNSLYWPHIFTLNSCVLGLNGADESKQPRCWHMIKSKLANVSVNCTLMMKSKDLASSDSWCTLLGNNPKLINNLLLSLAATLMQSPYYHCVIKQKKHQAETACCCKGPCFNMSLSYFFVGSTIWM